VVLKYKDLIASAADPVFYVGAGVSFVVGCAAIGFLLRFLRTSGFAAFAIYRLVFAAFVIVMLFVKS
jgi:undecaprenyl pyrophosphate phosphatase UppP